MDLKASHLLIKGGVTSSADDDYESLRGGREYGISSRPIGPRYIVQAASEKDALLYSYAIWNRPENDAANRLWHRATIAALDKFAVGHYISESDIVADPSRAERSYAPANWERLQTLRQQYDPEQVFCGHFSTH